MEGLLTSQQIEDIFLKMYSLLTEEAKQEMEEYLLNVRSELRQKG